MLQLDYLRMKSNLFQGFPDAIPLGIQQLRDAACVLRETLQRKATADDPLAAQTP